MKKIIFIAVAAMMAISASAQGTVKKIRVYDGNTVVYEREYNSVDSIVFVDVEDAVEPEGMLPGAFSVGENTRVHFSSGNLQYQASTQTWRFAEHQYDRIGDGNANISDTYEGWIDLFAWGTGNNPTSASWNYEDYPTFVDWGVNAISNGGNEANQWRTLTSDEWIYLFLWRSNASSLFGFGTVNDIHGLIVLPDNWVTPQGASFTPSIELGLAYYGDSMYVNPKDDNYTHNIYTAEGWQVMEQHGAVFMPSGGIYDTGGILRVDVTGSYWSSSPKLDFDSPCYALSISFGVGGIDALGQHFRPDHISVRLVR